MGNLKSEHRETIWNRKHPHPSVSTDIVALGIRMSEGADWRQQETMTVSMALIRRGKDPFEGCWALPGGFFQTKDSSVEACAMREMQEETNLSVKKLISLGNFSSVGRDPRGWVLSLAYLAIIDIRDMTRARPCGGDDAKDAKWFDVHYIADKSGRMTIVLDSRDGVKFEFSACCKGNGLGQPTVEIVYAPKSLRLAFDHASIIATALYNLGLPGKRLRAFQFLGQDFTIAELRGVYEFMAGEEIIPQNFRRIVMPYIEETGAQKSGAGHRPAALYRWTNEFPE